MTIPILERYSGLPTRILTAGAYALLTLLAIWYGPLPTALLFGVMGAFAAREYQLLRQSGRGLSHIVYASAAAGLMPLAAVLWGAPGVGWTVIALFAAVSLRHTLSLRVRASETTEILFGAVYVGVLLSHTVLISTFTDGRALLLTLVASVWAADVAAYLFGIAFGRHKLAPRISPKKSWEGFVAGVGACTAVWMVLPDLLGATVAPLTAALTGGAVALSSVLGDLFESRLKREVGVKDSGNSLPGHGGILDRIDSLLFAGAIAYWALVWAGA